MDRMDVLLKAFIVLFGGFCGYFLGGRNTKEQLTNVNCSAFREREKNITEVTMNSSCISLFIVSDII
ncbi:Protein of unknown function [Bacillus wiedmannii]|uniref:Uncharacterized protein n=1 Tax=Bacillus wiedmannii TaxID=1890302 RepID=A0A1C4DJB7_9BACI|nr:Protein of unknown function [Bacillus wiedmannii]